jgi:hypothetical protein
MRLLRELEVPQTSRDQVFRASRLHSVLFVMSCLAACAAIIVYRRPVPRPSYYISAVILALLFFRSSLRNRTLSSLELARARRR